MPRRRRDVQSQVMKHLSHVGIVGAGLVGSGWAIVFARAGLDVSVYDANEGARSSLLQRVGSQLDDMRSAGLIADPLPILERVSVHDSLSEAVSRAEYIQESVLERVEVKKAACAQISAAMRPDAVVGSSSSGIPASAFTEELERRDRFLVAHPVNPPHLVPLVELVPAPWTDPAIMPWLRGEMERVGQAPIEVRAEIEGFVLNRLQGALLFEAWALYRDGYASLADIDRTVSAGLGLRWSFMGPFETVDLNAPGGIDDYARRLGPLYHRIAASRSDPLPWSEELVERVRAERREALAKEQLDERCQWRDRRLMALAVQRSQAGEED